ncbi:hypothetical protein AJ80_05325 [Polytolypa hystricis UAMH7299]|uniref:Phospholipase D1 n=1 Tax=Polytolypa hystricis (strain UAMH7299) TaxID=1447883 RepID=A0A2B7Y4E8_POLH7|nr:hypothetical protein AJ80_05325 [Polytolypa hystricis UAMH7299]
MAANSSPLPTMEPGQLPSSKPQNVLQDTSFIPQTDSSAPPSAHLVDKTASIPQQHPSNPTNGAPSNPHSPPLITGSLFSEPQTLREDDATASTVSGALHTQDLPQRRLDQPFVLKPSSIPSRNASNDSVKPYRFPPNQQMRSSGTATPPNRRSVQFARGDNEAQQAGGSHSRASSIGGEDGDALSKDKRAHYSLLSKLRAFAASPSLQAHSRSTSGVSATDDFLDARQAIGTPSSERGEFRFPSTLEEEGSEVDADAESSAEEHPRGERKKKRRFRPRPDSESHTESYTAPTTPKSTARPPFAHGQTTLDSHRTSYFGRWAGPSAVPPQAREGVSEDEGRERLSRDAMWRRRSGWLQSARGLNLGGGDTQESQNTQERRPSNLRRLTGFGGPSENAEGLGAAWRRHRGDRGSSLSAQKWRQIKAGLKMIGQRRKVETTVDHEKSAELLAELSSGIPAALIFASMFQRDEHGSRRIPILLEQLKVHVTDSHIDSHSGDRHLVFRIELEYGSGITRMKWVIHRTLRDFANLHLKYKLQIGTQKYIQLKSSDSANSLPHFPRSAFPYLRGVRGLESDEDEEDEVGYETAADATSGGERAAKKKKRRSSFGLPRRQSSLTPQEGAAVSGALTPGDGRRASFTGGAVKKDTYPERQRKKLEVYLQKMIRFLIFRPDSNRLCKFLELSALGVRLAAEGSYHGKEGFLVIQSSKGLDFRRALNPSMMKSRHSPKWFLVRHSYVVCVDSPEEMHIYDVFMVDPFFQIQAQKVRLRDQKPKELAKSAKESAAHPQHHTLKLHNSERKLRLLARNERQLHQFEDSIRFMVDNTPWSKPNRFDSFAPVRHNCFAQWLVDGRDYMWVVSRAINQAKDVIYIHDWWLSPELYMRRPAAISQKWRLDRLLQRKAQEGVKIFVIMYRNINSAMPIDSEYSKFSLLDLHPNVFVQRSPNQIRQNTFFWAHHEKICIVDHTIAFVGGIDLCFGRWDTPQHIVTDDKLTGFELTDMPKDGDHCQLWPGKDYSNPRVQDFYDLDKPYEEMYDREVVPRMPWHDISMHVVGQPARDLTRHFVQRWNYILRQRKPTRPTPFLLPPPDFNPADLEALGLDGTCEVQILRSSSMWSTGTPDVTEHSIMNAYIKLIEQSDHFVYIENQFFISSCEVEGKKIENKIGDALVERIVRAAKNDEDWRAVILLPLMPGFQNTVDTEGGTSVRLIMQCQYRSICRGESSIFGRLRAQGIEPDDYIQFFSLRSWGKIGLQKRLVTEQLYIHAKCMVVDDRVAIIGSANINERSMLGSRDSECAAIVRDTDMFWSSMGGKPYLVGRFPHTLRMRLMREHLGVDVDEVMEEEMVAETEARQANGEQTNPASGFNSGPADNQSVASAEPGDHDLVERRRRLGEEFLTRSEDMHSFNHDVDWEQAGNPNLKSNRKLTADSRVTSNPGHRKDLDGLGFDQMKRVEEAGHGIGRDSQVLLDSTEVLAPGTPHRPGTKRSTSQTRSTPPSPQKDRETDKETADNIESKFKAADRAVSRDGINNNDGSGASSHCQPPQEFLDHSHPLATELKQPTIDKSCMIDPLCESFYIDTWQKVAENNTKLFRDVFRCMPDSEVKSWKEYKEYTTYAERFADMQSNHHKANGSAQTHSSSNPKSGPPGAATVSPTVRVGEELQKVGGDLMEKVQNAAHSNNEQPTDETLRLWASEANRAQVEREELELAGQESPVSQSEKNALKAADAKSSHSSQHTEGMLGPSETWPRRRSIPQSAGGSDIANQNIYPSQSQRRRRRAATRSSRREFHASDDIVSMQEAGDLMNMVQGHLVQWPYDWLEREEQGGNWLYTLDQISPLEI